MSARLPLCLGLILSLGAAQALAQTPARTDGVMACRTRKLVGYGLVVGLRDTGDHLKDTPFTLKSLQAMLARSENTGFDVSAYDSKVAAAMVTARMRTCLSADGSYDAKLDRAVDLELSAMGDAKSLQGGALLMTPLLGADGRAYAIGQGVLAACPDPRAEPASACVPDGGVVARQGRAGRL
ncbi:flagellar basal body P-ring protein FlgI [Caulobacter sp. S45]|uniref:flagellar basal body P-ring protein FlgI n=1 Tax=Caulobacter sp. S45 TaxID=1641861 RepID=UPI00131B431E|nr:flagellar basal body P-ring protein FlgI [Caulobacter sp. S45]